MCLIKQVHTFFNNTYIFGLMLEECGKMYLQMSLYELYPSLRSFLSLFVTLSLWLSLSCVSTFCCQKIKPSLYLLPHPFTALYHVLTGWWTGLTHVAWLMMINKQTLLRTQMMMKGKIHWESCPYITGNSWSVWWVWGYIFLIYWR